MLLNIMLIMLLTFLSKTRLLQLNFEILSGSDRKHDLILESAIVYKIVN